MKKIDAVIKPFKLEEVREALAGLGIVEVTVAEVRGFGRQKGRRDLHRGSEYPIDFVPKVKVELVVPEELADEAVDAILAAARTGTIGDGKVFISPVDLVPSHGAAARSTDVLSRATDGPAGLPCSGAEAPLSVRPE